MQIDPALHSYADNYKVLTNVIVPRPIAWVTSLNQTGIINLAPFSFFNAVGSDPLYLVVSIGFRDDGAPKDTAKNIEVSGEFVVNLVTEDLLSAMNVSAADFPPAFLLVSLISASSILLFARLPPDAGAEMAQRKGGADDRDDADRKAA